MLPVEACSMRNRFQFTITGLAVRLNVVRLALRATAQASQLLRHLGVLFLFKSREHCVQDPNRNRQLVNFEMLAQSI